MLNSNRVIRGNEVFIIGKNNRPSLLQQYLCQVTRFSSDCFCKKAMMFVIAPLLVGFPARGIDLEFSALVN